MAFDFNPITGNLDLVDSPAGYINGVVDDPTQLPVTLGTPPLDAVYLSKGASGLWLINRKPAGLYCRVANNGVAADWTYLGAFPEVNSSANWSLYDGTTPSKELKFDLSGIATSTTRTLTVPNASGRIQVEGQPIGNVTASTGAFTTLSASDALTASNATASPPTTLAATKGVQWLLPANGYAAIAGIYPGGAAISLLTGSPGGMTEHARFGGGSSTITFNSPLTAAAGTFTTLAATGTSHTFGVSNPAADTTIEMFGAGAANRLHKIIAAVGQGISFQTGSTAVQGPLMQNGGHLRLAALGTIRWGNNSNNPAAGSDSIEIARDADDTVAMRRGANAQTFRLYGQLTGTDVSATGNYERGFMRWSAAGGTFQIGTEKGSGGGTARDLVFQTDGVTRVTIGATSGWATFAGRVVTSQPMQCPNIGTVGDGNAGWVFGATLAVGSSVTSVNLPSIVRYGGTTNLFPALKRDSTTLQVRLANDSDFAPLACGALTLNGNLDASTRDIVTDTTTGTKIGTGTTQKIGFFNATPVVQQAAVADATDAASTQARLNDLLARLRTLGLIAT